MLRFRVAVFYFILILWSKSTNGSKAEYVQCPFERYLGVPQGDEALPNSIKSSSPLVTPPAMVYTLNNNEGESVSSNRHFLEDFFLPKQKEAITCAIPPQQCILNQSILAYRTLDGSCNNLQYPGYGMAKTRYIRLMAPKYGDGMYSPSISVTGSSLPTARQLSLSLYGEKTLPDSYRTLAATQWGQLVAHDMSQLTTKGAPDDCCSSPNSKLCYPMPLLPNDPIAAGSGKSCLKFARSLSDIDVMCPSTRLSYAEKISLTTSYLDLSSIYGNSLKDSQKYRTNRGGLLKTSLIGGRQHLLMSSKTDDCGTQQAQCYNIPDQRNQFTPTIAIFHTIFVREHNRIASALQILNPHYSNEQLFQMARKINIAQYQKITYYDWLPLLLGQQYMFDSGLIREVPLFEYIDDYDETVNSAVYASFAAAAFRYFHSQIPGWFSLVSPNRNVNQTMRLSDYFDRPMDIMPYNDNMNSIIRGLATQYQKRADTNIDMEIKHYMDRKPDDEFGTDLKALDIQRGRDFGLPSYNDFRQFCGLPRANNWSGFRGEISAEKIALMQSMYQTPEDVELNVGGSLEQHVPGSSVGPTFQCIIARQFRRTRIGDRFFFEREDVNSGFTREQLAEIRKASLSSLFCNNGDDLRLMQQNSFVVPNARNLLQACSSIPTIDLSKFQDFEGYK